MIANDFLAHILHHLPLPKDKVELVKKHAQTFVALCATGGCLLCWGELQESGLECLTSFIRSALLLSSFVSLTK